MLSWISEVPPSIELPFERSHARGIAPRIERSLSHSSARDPPVAIARNAAARTFEERYPRAQQRIIEPPREIARTGSGRAPPTPPPGLQSTVHPFTRSCPGVPVLAIQQARRAPCSMGSGPGESRCPTFVPGLCLRSLEVAQDSIALTSTLMSKVHR